LKQYSAWLALAGLIILMFAGSAYGEDQPPRYLAFQFFTASGGAQNPLRTAKGSTHKKTGVAVGFHIDDSMFWGRLKELNTPENIE
jgi:hypothetical protein